MSKLYICLLPHTDPPEAHRWHCLARILQQRCHFFYLISINPNNKLDFDHVIQEAKNNESCKHNDIVIIMPLQLSNIINNSNHFNYKIILMTETQNHFKQILEDSSPSKKVIPKKDKNHYCCFQFFQRKNEDNYLYHNHHL